MLTFILTPPHERVSQSKRAAVCPFLGARAGRAVLAATGSQAGARWLTFQWAKHPRP